MRSRNPIVLGGALVAGFALIAGGGLSAVAANADSTSTKSAVAAFLPQFEGKLAKGQTLSAVPGSWAKAGTVSYQWLRDGKSIKGATAATYKIAKRDAKHSIALRAAVKTKAGTTTGTSVQRVVSSIKHAVKAKAVTVKGEGKVGAKLTAKHAKWQGKKKAKATVRYQWTRDGFLIAGATHKTYQVTAADAGHDLTAVAKGKAKGLARAIRVSNTVAVAVPAPPAPTPGTPIYKDGVKPSATVDPRSDLSKFELAVPAWNGVKLANNDNDLLKFELFASKATKPIYTSNTCYDKDKKLRPANFCTVADLIGKKVLTSKLDKLVIANGFDDAQKAGIKQLPNGDYTLRVTLNTKQVKTATPFEYSLNVQAVATASTYENDADLYPDPIKIPGVLSAAMPLYLPTWADASGNEISIRNSADAKIEAKFYAGKKAEGTPIITFAAADVADQVNAGVADWDTVSGSGDRAGWDRLKVYPYKGLTPADKTAFSKIKAFEHTTLVVTITMKEFQTPLVATMTFYSPVDQSTLV